MPVDLFPREETGSATWLSPNPPLDPQALQHGTSSSAARPCSGQAVPSGMGNSFHAIFPSVPHTFLASVLHGCKKPSPGHAENVLIQKHLKN